MAPAKRLLIADDDRIFRRLLVEQFENQDEFLLVESDVGDAVARVMSDGRFDAVLVGVDAQGDSAIRVSDLRQAGLTCSIVVLVAPGAVIDPLALTERGASCVLAKPFRIGVLLSRLRSLIAARERHQDALLAIGPYILNTTAKALQPANNGNHRIRLTEKETAILAFLHQAGGVVSRETLLRAVWGYAAGVTTHTLETHIYRLRQKIESDPANATILVTDDGGYRLVP